MEGEVTAGAGRSIFNNPKCVFYCMPKNLFPRPSHEKGVFLDERFLYQEHIPDRLPHRDRELDSLAYCFKPILANRKPLNVFLAGPTGVGKTVCVKCVLAQLQESHGRAKSLYLNCFEYNSRAAVLIALANFVGAAVPRRGLATDEVFTGFLQSLEKAPFTPIIVLDEVDQLLLNEENSKLLYDLLRVVEYGGKSIGVVLISNDVELTSKLDARIRSSLAQEAVIFSAYTPQQLKEILSERAELAFSKGAYEKDVINIAAAHAGKLGGDCRVGLESLLKAGRIAERANSAKVTVEHLRQAFEAVDAISSLKALKHLAKDELVLLRIIAENSPVNSGRLYELYAKSPGAQLKERRLREILAKLEKQNMISAAEIILGNRGKTRQFSTPAQKERLLSEIKSLGA